MSSESLKQSIWIAARVGTPEEFSAALEEYIRASEPVAELRELLIEQTRIANGYCEEMVKARAALSARAPDEQPVAEPPERTLERFEQWFKSNYPLFREDRDTTLKHRLWTAWQVATLTHPVQRTAMEQQPTEAMIDAGLETYEHGLVPTRRERVRKIWQAMVDAALRNQQ